ncbi:alanine racemase [Kitasatospora sp. NPDC002227]|uniref:alanine racemase n=1 Tax=Kitasatospora sp. NPDC002227 TaxID=3154773 RepID=UPI0033282AEA
MTLSLAVDTARWRAHQRAVLAEFPGLVPVAKGNGYGLGNARLAAEAELLGTPLLAVGTAAEAAAVLDHFRGDVLVLTPYRAGEDQAELPARVIRTVAHLEALRALPPGSRVVVECMTSMRRHGIAPADLPRLPMDGVVFEGFALHLPLDRPGEAPGDEASVAEVTGWVEAVAAAGLPTGTVFLSHLGAAGVARLAARFPGTDFRSRIGTRLWLGDPGALTARATVLDVTPIVKGDRYGYRQHRAPSDGHLLVVTGGTAHGVGLEAPKYLHGMVPRAKGLARAGLATVNRTLSPYSWTGRQLWFAEPPHMQVSILFLPGDTKPPVIGDELPLNTRHTTTHFDRVVDR